MEEEESEYAEEEEGYETESDEDESEYAEEEEGYEAESDEDESEYAEEEEGYETESDEDESEYAEEEEAYEAESEEGESEHAGQAEELGSGKEEAAGQKEDESGLTLSLKNAFAEGETAQGDALEGLEETGKTEEAGSGKFNFLLSRLLQIPKKLALQGAILFALIFGGLIILHFANVHYSSEDRSEYLVTQKERERIEHELRANTPPPTPTPTPDPYADKPDIDVTSWEFVLANPWHSIEEYQPETALVENIELDNRIIEHILAFRQAASEEGLQMIFNSGYRSYETQEWLFQRQINVLGDNEEVAATIVARPGTSEHQTGLAADITDGYYDVLTGQLEHTPLYQWMYSHCQEYGFIVRFPKGKESITGIIYEPWHFRYVGVEAAAYIMEHGLTLEEFLALYGIV